MIRNLPVPLLAIVAAILLSPAARGDERLKPYLNEQTLAMLRIDATRIDLPGIEKWLLDGVQRVGVPQADFDEVARELHDGLTQADAMLKGARDAGLREAFGVVALDVQSPAALLIPHHGKAQELNAVLGGLATTKGELLELEMTAITGSRREPAEATRQRVASPRPDLSR